MRISAVFIVKNEQDMIVAALESVKEADEIIVIDTGSTDLTKEIAARYTDKIFDFPWIDDFAAARNEAIRHATGDWIYSIDADQLLLSPIKALREEARLAEEEGHKVLLVKTLAGPDRKQIHWREVFFKNDPEVYWVGAVHEALTMRGTKRSTIERFRGSSPSKAADPERNLRILEGQEKTQRNLFYLGRENYERKRYGVAIKWLTNYIQNPSWTGERAEAYLTLARCYWFTNQGDKAREACLEAVRLNPMFREALLLMSTLYHSPNKEKWAALAKAADNSDVLFIRT